MRDLALVMAGGGGARMSASGVQLPKPLVPVGGVSLLERNVGQLLRHGFRAIVIAAPRNEPRIADFIDRSLRPVANAQGAQVETLLESSPLGNFGAVRELAERERDALVVFADNLTDLDLRDLFDDHRDSGAALTAATHVQRFRMPFGEVSLQDGAITRYREKPSYDFMVCSAICAVSTRAMVAVGHGEALGLGQLVDRLLSSGEVVRAYPHQAAWIDVNDAVSLAEAERLVRDRPDDFGITSSNAGSLEP